MSFQKFTTNSYCVGQKHYSGTKNIVAEIRLNKKPVKIILFVGQFCICNRKKSIIMSDNTTEAEGLGSFFKNLGKISAKAGKKLATNALKNPARFLGIGANVAIAAASRKFKAALSTLPEKKIFSITQAKFSILENLFKFLYNKWSKT